MSAATLDLTALEHAVLDRQGKKQGDEILFLCPAHDDHDPSASYNVQTEQWHCFACNAGGGFKDLAQWLEVDLHAGRSPTPKAKVKVGPSRPKVVATYDYYSADGTLLFHVDRREPGKDGKAKDFMQRRANGEYGLGDTQPVLYRLPQVREQVATGGAVYLAEGEKDVHTLEALGKVATCNPMGAGKWRDEYSDALQGAHVTLLPDHDEPGRAHMLTVARSLQGKLKSLRVLTLPDLPPKGDVSDWRAAGHTQEDLDAAVQAAPLWTLSDDGAAAYDGFVSANLDKLESPLGEDEQAWETYLELPPKRLPVPNLPPEMLPEPLRDWLVDAAERTCLPLELTAAPAVVSLGAVVGRKVGIYPKKRDDWLVVPNLWGGVVGRPGIMKTTAVAEGTKPLKRLAAEASQSYQDALLEAEVASDTLKIELETIKKEISTAAKKGHKDKLENLKAEMVAKRKELEHSGVSEKRYVTQDATTEKLGELLRDNAIGLMLLRDELAGWLKTLDKPGREGDREFYLEAWNGTGSYTFDRIMRGTTHIPSLCLSVFGSIQPGKLEHYLEGALSQGGGDDGLLQRLQVLVWPDGLQDWQNNDRYPDTAAKNRAYEVYQKLDNLTAERLNLDTQEGDIPALNFSDDAQALFDTWRGELEHRLRSDELAYKPAFESHLAKYRSLMPSLALLFHLVDIVDGGAVGPVSLDAAKLAAGWCAYLELHAVKLYSSETLSHLDAAHALAAKIEEGQVKDEMSVRDVYAKDWEGLDKDAVEQGLEVLTEYKWTRLEPRVGPKGGRPSNVIRLHPDLRGFATGGKK